MSDTPGLGLDADATGIRFAYIREQLSGLQNGASRVEERVRHVEADVAILKDSAAVWRKVGTGLIVGVVLNLLATVGALLAAMLNRALHP